MRCNITSVLIGIAGTIALSETMSFTMEKTPYTNSMASFLLGILAVCALKYVYFRIDRTDRRGRILSGIYSFGLSFSLTAGKQLQTAENFAVGDISLWIQITVLALFLWGLVWYGLQYSGNGRIPQCPEYSDEKTIGTAIIEADKKTEQKSFFLIWLVIFLCWIPVFLAVYPGAFVYDAQDEYVQVATRTFTTHHPLAHVLMLGGFVCLGNKLFGSYNVGIAMYTVVQMIVLSGVFAYAVSYIRMVLFKKMPEKTAKYICGAVVLFYGLFPVIPMYAVCSAKDTLFNAAFLVMLVQILKLSGIADNGNCITKKTASDHKDRHGVSDFLLLVCSATVMMLFRNNGVYVVIVLTGILLAAAVYYKIVTEKGNNRKGNAGLLIGLSVGFLAAILFHTCADKLLTTVLHADDSESQELLTVPIQQLARAYKYSPEVFTQEDKDILFSYIPEEMIMVYDADLSDLVKSAFDNEKYDADPSSFNRLWVRTFAKKPVTYLNAWLMTSYGYWYPDTVINVYGGQQRFTYQYEESSYFGFETEQPGVRESKFPWLEEVYRKLSLELYQQKVPVISMFFSPGFLFWTFMGSILMCLYRKQYLWLIPLGSIFLLWGTAILGPTFLVRYVLLLWFALPLWSMVYYYDMFLSRR